MSQSTLKRFDFHALCMVHAIALLLSLLAVLPLPALSQQRSVAAINIPGVVPADLTGYASASEQLSRGDVKAALASLQAEEAMHENDPAYFNLVGNLALFLRDFPVAASALERVVMMQPDNAGAWMDFAVSSLEIGNYASALSYFGHVESAFEPTPALRAVIAQYRARMLLAPKVDLGWKFIADGFVGTDTNVNSGLANNNIPLTLAGQRVDLPLDASYLARGDQFIQSNAQGNYKRQFEFGELELTMGLRQRDYRLEHDFSTREANFGAGMRRAFLRGYGSAGLYYSHLTLGSTPLIYTLRGVAQYEQPMGECRWGVSSEIESRHYLQRSSLNSNILWGQMAEACSWGGVRWPIQATVIGRAGLDNANGERVGGDTRRIELIAQIAAPLVGGMQGEFSYKIARDLDTQGYSPLLEDNAPRQIERRNLRLLLTQPLQMGIDLTLSVEHSHVWSNLPLFRQSGRVIGIGIRKIF